MIGGVGDTSELVTSVSGTDEVVVVVPEVGDEVNSVGDVVTGEEVGDKREMVDAETATEVVDVLTMSSSAASCSYMSSTSCLFSITFSANLA